MSNTSQQAALVESAPSFLDLTDLQLLLFGGKGGVGKTTCAAATALHLAVRRPDCDFLVVSTDPAHSLKDSFSEPRTPPNLEIIEINARECLEKFKRANIEHLRQIALSGTFLDNDDVSKLLDLSMPGLDEMMAFDEISSIVALGNYSCVIVDTAATGHTLRFLALPEMLRRWVAMLDTMMAKHRYMARLYRGFYRKSGTDLFLENLAASIGRLAALLNDPVRSRFVPVMLAEALSTSETARLLDRLEFLKIPVEEILVNRIYPEMPGCPGCREVRNRQRTELHELSLKFRKYSLWEIPLQGAEVRGVEQLCAFWEFVRPVDVSGEDAAPATPQPPAVDRPVSAPEAGARLLLFAGKGGVGKTTLAGATAFYLARRYPGKEVLLFSTDPAHSLSDCLDMRVGSEETRICPGLTAMELNAEAEFEKLRKQFEDEAARFFASLTGPTMDVQFDRQVIERIMDLSPPGLDEVMALTRIVELLDAGKYDTFVFDTAPTGHLIRLLELPEIIQAWLRVFFGIMLKYRDLFRLPGISKLMVTMSKNIKVLKKLLSDPQRGQIYPVSILTEMAFEETRDLVAACEKAGIRTSALFLNLATGANGCSLCNDLAATELGVRNKYQSTFKNIPQAVVYRCHEPRGPALLAELGRAMYVN